MLTRRQVKARLGIGKAEFLRLVKTGELRAIRTSDAPNSPFRVFEESLDEYIERREFKPDKAAAS